MITRRRDRSASRCSPCRSCGARRRGAVLGDAALIVCPRRHGGDRPPRAAPGPGSSGSLERDERLFAVLLAFVMVGGLATLGLVPLRPRYQVRRLLPRLWFAAYKAGVFALVTVNPRATRADLHRRARRRPPARLLPALPHRRRRQPRSTSSSSRSSRSTRTTSGRGSACCSRWSPGCSTPPRPALAPPWAGWTAGDDPDGCWSGCPPSRSGYVADRERRARSEVERLNVELTGHAHAAAGRPGEAGGGRAHGHGGAAVAQGRARGAQPHRRHRAQRGAARRHRAGAGEARDGARRRRSSARSASRWAPSTRSPRSTWPSRGSRRPQFEEDSVNDMVRRGHGVRAARSPRARGSRSRWPRTRPSRRWRSTARSCARPC